MKRLGVDAPSEWLYMAKDARRRQVAEPAPSELAHRAFKAKLAAATTSADLTTVIQEIKDFFPASPSDKESGRISLTQWEGRYGDDPASTYTEAPPQYARRLDRRIWAGTPLVCSACRPQDVPSAVAAAGSGSECHSGDDHAAGPVEKATTTARQDLVNLRFLSEARALATVYREKLQQPSEALKVLGDWLKSQQDRLSSTDAEGPLELANLYDELIQDRVTAVELLRKAWRIDPSSKEIAEAFRSRGFRKAKDDWVESVPAAQDHSAAASASSNRPPPIVSQGLLRLTADEVRTRLGGKPDRVSYVAIGDN